MSQAPLIRAALCSPPYSTLTYSLPDLFPAAFWKPGLRIAVPLGRGRRMAVLLGAAEAEAGITLKPVFWPLETQPLLGESYLELVAQLALRQAIPAGRILGNVLPAPLRSSQVRFRRFAASGRPKDLSLAHIAAMEQAEQRDLAQSWLAGEVLVLGRVDDPLDAEQCVLKADPPWPVRPRAARQLALLEYLYAHGEVSRRRLADMFGADVSPVINTLAARDLVEVKPVPERDFLCVSPRRGPVVPELAYQLTGAQQEALAAFQSDLDQPGRAGVHLLHGVTGSGKTAVYLSLAAATLARGKSVMLLAPEVALALKLKADAARDLPGVTVHLYHGYLSPREREVLFRELASAPEPVLVVGTRSALFLPLPRLGAIVLDEEHDGSFKQDEGLHYQAKEVAWFRSRREQALLVLGSATPDIKTFHAAGQGGIHLHSMPDRVGGGTLPAVRLVPLPKQTAEDGVLAAESREALIRTVEKGEQAIILLNRRGYAPLMYCLGCASVLRCPHCAISLTYHKGRERVVCHYCGHAAPFPCPCPDCGALTYLPMGEGTEKLEESLLPRLPAATSILRLDRDSTRRPGRMEEILSAFGRKEASVLIGTQMLSKGHHFPDVTLVVVADADLGLNIPDYRAAERTFQLLVQASGRAGRGERPGEVLVQTRDPGHYCWQYVLAGDYQGFFRQEIERRQRRLYPPFVRLALLRLSFPAGYAQGLDQVEMVAAAVRKMGKERGVSVLGPAPAPLAQLMGRRRYHCLLKGQDWRPMRECYAAACAAAGRGEMRLSLDIDPVNML